MSAAPENYSANRSARSRPRSISLRNFTTVQAAKNATTTIPIVMSRVSDAVELGFVPSLAHPGGETHVSKTVRLHKQENLIVDNMAPHNVFKSSNFSDRFLVPTLVRSCP